MSLFTGITNQYLTTNGSGTKQYLTIDGSDTKTAGELNMDFFPLRGIAAPTEDFDAISNDYFKRNSEYQTVLYKYPGFTNLDVKHLPNYNHGNHRGSDVLHSSNYTDNSILYLNDISFDNDSTDYNIGLRFHAKLIYKDKSVSETELTSGNGLDLTKKDNYDIDFFASFPPIVRWINLDLQTKLKDISKKPVPELRFIIIIVEQSSGATGGQEFVVHCSVREY